MSEDELGEKLYKSLSGRRYLIVMDDIWCIETWERVMFFFPDNNNGSRILITTRLSNLAFQLSGSCDALEMSFLDGDKSWSLLCKSVFGEEVCPLELEDIGKKIAENCKGLPLLIVVIGGLLAKSKRTRKQWDYIANNLIPAMNLEDNERCLRMLSLSYSHLPVYLKPCFLYMGIFPEDRKIHVSILIKLWIAEGFLKPISGKSLEAVAEEYLEDLIDRNLVLVHKLGSAGNIKFCTVHDLLRDLCIKEAEKDNFFRVAETHRLHIGKSWHTQRRFGIHEGTSFYAVQSASLARSLVCDSIEGLLVAPCFRLLRVFNAVDELRYFASREWGAYPLEDIFQLVNSRHLAIVAKVPKSKFPSSVYQLWNLQTLIVDSNWDFDTAVALFDIWKMPQLRHVKFNDLKLPPPPTGHIMDDGRDDFVVMQNLETLKRVRNFNCGEEVVKRIPNIKKLEIYYEGIEESSRTYCLNNLFRLRKLESLCCSCFREETSGSELAQSLILPHSLKKLTLEGTKLHWEDMATKIGSLPHLQVLRCRNSFIGPVWETVEDQFPSLKYLLISECDDLESWRAESTHFPCLEHLLLEDVYKLQEIPSEIGDISTLKSIELDGCSDSAVISVKEIVKEQDDLGNEGLQVRVQLRKKNQVLESLASHNFNLLTC